MKPEIRHTFWEESACISVYLMMLYETNEKWKNKIQQQRQKIKISSVTIIKTANKWKLFSHLSVSFLCPPNATTVWIAARTSSATAPAFAYAVSSLLVNAEIICVEEKSFNFPVQTKTEPAQSLYWFIWIPFFFFFNWISYLLFIFLKTYRRLHILNRVVIFILSLRARLPSVTIIQEPDET